MYNAFPTGPMCTLVDGYKACLPALKPAYLMHNKNLRKSDLILFTRYVCILTPLIGRVDSPDKDSHNLEKDRGESTKGCFSVDNCREEKKVEFGVVSCISDMSLCRSQ